MPNRTDFKSRWCSARDSGGSIPPRWRWRADPTVMTERVTLDLTKEVRDALALTFHRTTSPIGFFVQPDVVASTDDERALKNLVRELVAAVAATPTTSSAPVLVFDRLHTDEATFYAISMLAQVDAPQEPIAPRVDEAAAASGALVWDADPAEGEARVVCFALDAEETDYSPSR